MENSISDLILVVLRGSDGKEDHCITVCERWLFDSNFEFALPLCQDSLDLCCSTDETQEKFEAVADARVCAFVDATKSIENTKTNINTRKRRRKMRKNLNKKMKKSNSQAT